MFSVFPSISSFRQTGTLCLSAIFAGYNNVIFTIIHNGLQRWTESAEGYGTAYCILYTRKEKTCLRVLMKLISVDIEFSPVDTTRLRLYIILFMYRGNKLSDTIGNICMLIIEVQNSLVDRFTRMMH